MTALLAALITALTYYGRIPFPMSNGGYVHLGDGMVCIAACLLSAPYAVAAAAIGAGMADALLGFYPWIPATLVLKACMALLFSAKREKLLCPRNILALPLAALVNTGGYFLYESLIYRQWAAMLSAVGNLVQSAVAAAIFLLLAAALDHLNIKRKFMNL